jgi:hypothetical protein
MGLCYGDGPEFVSGAVPSGHPPLMAFLTRMVAILHQNNQPHMRRCGIGEL